MLHVSYVHSFGSRNTPLPSSIKFESINDYHGKSTFLYSPNENTISGYVGNVREVKVENEFILPTTTLTRVFAGDTIKQFLLEVFQSQKIKLFCIGKFIEIFG